MLSGSRGGPGLGNPNILEAGVPRLSNGAVELLGVRARLPLADIEDATPCPKLGRLEELA